MDGSPQVVRFDATTLWHLDAAEWAPSTASKAEKFDLSTRCLLCPRKPTCATCLAMSALCQKRTHARQQMRPQSAYRAFRGRADAPDQAAASARARMERGRHGAPHHP